MNYGLYLSASGALSNMHRQDVLANNLANMNTVGFKPDQVDNRQRLPERLESPGGFTDPKLMLERIGGGLFIQPTRADLSQGALTATKNDLDVALDGDGMFVVGDGISSGIEEIRLTRDGRFTLDARGELVLAANGLKVLGEDNRPIRLDPTQTARIDQQGSIIQNGAEVARIQIAAAPDARDLIKAGDNLFRLTDGSKLKAGPAEGMVKQGFTEASAVDPILTMNAMMSAAKAAQANLTMIQHHDHILGQTMNTFARVG